MYPKMRVYGLSCGIIPYHRVSSNPVKPGVSRHPALSGFTAHHPPLVKNR
jgi:hypothetical protein